MNRQDHELVVHDPWLRRVARRLARTRTRADDLVQDTYATALRNAPPAAQMRPWLLAVMRKLAWGQVRGDRRRFQREQGYARAAPPLTLPDGWPDHGIDHEQLAGALARLPEPFQSTIVQRFLEGQSCAEIARRENIPAGTVRWRQARALELLRAELARPRRRFAFWAIPFLGAGARLWQSVVTRFTASKAVWLLLACAALLYALAHGTPPHAAVAADLAQRRDGLALADDPPQSIPRVSPAPGAHAPRAALGDGPAPGTPDDSLLDDASERVARQRPEASRSVLGNPLDVRRDDCTWDPVHGRRCAGAPGTASSDATCALIRQQLLAGDALTLGSSTGRAMLAVAMQAKRALAERLGCLSGLGGPGGAGSRPAGASKPADASKPDDSEPPPDDSEPLPDSSSSPFGECTIERDADGFECKVCPGPFPLPICKAPTCRLQTLAADAVCSVCSGVGGSSTDCPAGPVATCHSELVSGFVCTTCDGQPGPPECLPAECELQAGGCLRCVDPKDREATDCSLDYDAFSPSGFGSGGGTMTSCSSIAGIPNVSGLTCHYPGAASCRTTTEHDWHCLACYFRDGSSFGICSATSEALPGVFSVRPSDLPAPDHCVTELAPDGTVACETCTRSDLSATRSCR